MLLPLLENSGTKDMEKIVADASVIAKFFINEIYSEKAQKLRDSFILGQTSLIEPSLLFYEVMNAMLYSKVKKFTDDELKIIAKALVNYTFELFDLNEILAKKAVDIAVEYSISFYDAVYVALAITTNSKLYTADEKLLRATKLSMIINIKDF